MAHAAGAVMTAGGEIRVLRVDRDAVPLGGRGDVVAIVWPGMGARHRTMHCVRLADGETSDEWRHPGEAVYYVLRGSGWVEDRALGVRHEVRAGLIAHVDAGTPYVLRAREALVCVGGPCPPDPSLYARVPDARAASPEAPR
jgi:quercetin dioxygenase-like cupin family protein